MAINIEESRKEHSQSKKFISNNEWLEIFPEAEEFIRWKIKTLDNEIEELSSAVKEKISKILKREESKEREFSLDLVRAFSGSDLDNKIAQVKKLKRCLIKPGKNKNNIDDTMIEKAKQFPFQELVQFNQRGFAKCPFHDEKTGSFHLMTPENRAHCFSCGKSWDTIQFIMDRDKVNFIDAVKKLN